MEGNAIGESKAKQAWDKANTTRVVIKLNHNTDADILRALKRQESMQGFIKQAIRSFLNGVTSTEKE